MLDAHRAIPFVDRYVEQNSKDFDPRLLPILIDRALLCVAMGEYDRAEALVDRVLREVSPRLLNYPTYARAYLLQGALWNRRNEPQKALDAWRMGSYRKWSAGSPEEIILGTKLDDRADRNRYYSYFYTIVLGSATGEFSKEDLAFVSEYRLSKLRDLIIQFISILGALNLDFLSDDSIIGAFNHPLPTRRQREFVQSVAFLQTPPERLGDAFLHFCMAQVRQSAMTEGVPDDIEPLIWEYLKVVLDDAWAKRPDFTAFIPIAGAWAGLVAPTGWESLMPILRPELIPAAALMHGYRYLKLQRPKDARMFFQLVLEKAPEGSPLRPYASKQIERIDHGNPQ